MEPVTNHIKSIGSNKGVWGPRPQAGSGGSPTSMENSPMTGPDLDMIGALLPRVEGSLDAPGVVEDLERRFSEYDAAATEADRDRILDDLSGLVRINPRPLVHLLLTPEFACFRGREDVLLTVAYGYFMLGRAADALRLTSRMRDRGVRRPLLTDIMVRCLAATGRQDQARAVLESAPGLLEPFQPPGPLLGRLAVLRFLDGDVAGADALLERARPWFPVSSEDLEEMARHQVRLTDPGALDQDGYAFYADETNHEIVWRAYASDMTEATSRFHNATIFHNLRYQEAVTATLDAVPGLEVFVNFGSMCGVTDYRLALARPDVRVVGYDISPVAARLNAQHFHAPNLTFVSGAFEPAVAPWVVGKRVLLGHLRTGTLMASAQVSSLYAACRRMGIERIIADEPLSWSVLTWRFPRFDTGEHSLLMFNQMMSHDYEYIMGASGYKLMARYRDVITDHQSSHNFHASSTVAERLEAGRRAPH